MNIKRLKLTPVETTLGNLVKIRHETVHVINGCVNHRMGVRTGVDVPDTTENVPRKGLQVQVSQSHCDIIGDDLRKDIKNVNEKRQILEGRIELQEVRNLSNCPQYFVFTKKSVIKRCKPLQVLS